jgi:hypothetical protein
MLHVPQGDFYDYLVKYGASRELQRMEQIYSVLSCGSYSRLSYVLSGQCGPRGGGEPSYEKSSTGSQGDLMMMMSLMPLGVDNQGNPIPPYSLCDSYTFRTR